METQPPPPPPELSYPPLPPANTNWRLYLELLSFSFIVLPGIGQVVGPLILWVVKKDTIPEVNEEGKKVINFNLSWTLWTIASCGLGFIAWLIIAIIATLKAANNERFQHPLTIAFLK